MTDPEFLPGLPEAVDLIDESRVAFSQLVKRDRYDFELETEVDSSRGARPETNVYRVTAGERSAIRWA